MSLISITFLSKGTSFLIWDIGGQDKLRPLWRSYTRCTDGIVFVVDSVDDERMEEAKMELLRTAKSPENSCVPILVFANVSLIEEIVLSVANQLILDYDL